MTTQGAQPDAEETHNRSSIIDAPGIHAPSNVPAVKAHRYGCPPVSGAMFGSGN